MTVLFTIFNSTWKIFILACKAWNAYPNCITSMSRFSQQESYLKIQMHLHSAVQKVVSGLRDLHPNGWIWFTVIALPISPVTVAFPLDIYVNEKLIHSYVCIYKF